MLSMHWRAFFILVAAIIVLTTVTLFMRFTVDSAVEYDDIEEHFKYGSTGGERTAGFPYWIWKVLPKVCPDLLPNQSYTDLGMIYERGKDLPIGVSKRRSMGIDRVFLNCASCHVSTVRDTPTSNPKIYTAMPANLLDLKKFEKFFFSCAASSNFTPSIIIPQIQAAGADLDLIDRYVVYPVAVHLMRDGLLQLRDSFNFVFQQPDWGPGRVDTFNSAKIIFRFPLDKLSPSELIGTADFPSIWNQGNRQGMNLHWDGNNTTVQERNRSAAFGTGATPPTLDRKNILRIENWLNKKKAPRYPYHIDENLAAQGAPLYKEYCADCHGVSREDFSGKYVGKVMLIDQIKTDRYRLDSYTYELAVNQGTLYAGYPDEQFRNFKKTHGYANMPLDGLWLRAPYLHNGSVPTIRELLEPSENRPKVFYRGNDVYDRKKLGFVSNVSQEKYKRKIKKYFKFDTSLPGNGNFGHEGLKYGTNLSAANKEALVEFLKTF